MSDPVLVDVPYKKEEKKERRKRVAEKRRQFKEGASQAAPETLALLEGLSDPLPVVEKKKRVKRERNEKRTAFGKSDRNIGKIYLPYHRKSLMEAWELTHQGKPFKRPAKDDPVWTKSKAIFAEKYAEQVKKEVAKVKKALKEDFIDHSIRYDSKDIPSEVPGGVSLTAPAPSQVPPQTS